MSVLILVTASVFATHLYSLVDKNKYIYGRAFVISTTKKKLESLKIIRMLFSIV